MTRKICRFLLAFVFQICTIYISFTPHVSFADVAECDTVSIAAEHIGDSFIFQTNPRKIAVRADKKPPRTVDALCVDNITEGYYQIYATNEYSEGETNESFFLQIRYDDDTYALMCDPNIDEYHIVQFLYLVAVDPIKHALAALLGGTGTHFVRMSADEKQGLRVIAYQIEQYIQPDEHVGENAVGMNLAGIVYHVCKNGYDLLKSPHFPQDCFIQSMHLWPETDSRHCKISLKAVFKVGV